MARLGQEEDDANPRAVTAIDNYTTIVSSGNAHLVALLKLKEMSAIEMELLPIGVQTPTTCTSVVLSMTATQSSMACMGH